MAYTVIRTDLMSGMDVAADMVSLRVYDSEGSAPVECENGTIVEITGYETGEREIFKAKLASGESKMENCAIVATPEVMYDERHMNLDEFINEKGSTARGYIPRSRNMYSVTKEAFTAETVPSVGDTIGIDTNGKHKKSGTGWGKCVAVEVAGRYTYYVIQIAEPTAGAGA